MRTILKNAKQVTVATLVPSLWQYGLWSFQTGGFKSKLFSSSQKKKYLKLKSWLNFNAIIVFFYKVKKLRQFSEQNLNKWALNHVV